MTAEALTPVVESAEGGREAQRRLSDALGGTHLQVEGDALEVFVVGLHLSTEIAGDGRETQVVVFVEVVETEIDSNGQRVVASDMRGDDLGGDATPEFVGEGIGKGAAHGDVAGREGTNLFTLWRGLLH